MKKQDVVLGIDIGSYDIKFAMGLQNEEDIDIIAVSSIPTQGFSKGEITSYDRLSEVLTLGIERVIDSASCKPSQTAICLSSRLFFGLNAVSPLSSISGGVISHANITQLLQSGHQYYTQQHGITNRITHTIVQNYEIDQKQKVDYPWSKPALTLKAEMFLLFTHKSIIEAFNKLTKITGLVPTDIMCDQLALSQTMYHSNEHRQFAFLDIGADCTKLMIFNDQKPYYFKTFHQAGNDINELIENKFDVSSDEAEFLKIKFAKVCDQVNEDQKIILAHPKNPKQISQYQLNLVVENYLREVFSNIRVKLEQEQIDLHNTIMVLSGGTALLKGIVSLAEEVFKIEVKLVKPTQSGTKDLVLPPQFATVNGLVLSVLRNKHNQWFSTWLRSLNEINENNMKIEKNKKSFFAWF
jgi:cell division protein FtsA